MKLERQWQEVGPSSLVPEGAKVPVQLGELTIALVRLGGVVSAISDLCPHRGGSMSQGDLQGEYLYCPLHAWSFHIRTGEAFFPKGAKIACYRVEERDGRLYVEA